MQNKNNRWYRQNKFYHYHRQKGFDTNKYQSLKYVVQDLIDNEKLEVDNPLAISNQELGIYQNPLPHHATNNISWKINDNEVTHKWDPNGTNFISMINVAIRA